MRCFCNSWCVRNFRVMMLRLNKLAQSIVSLHTRLLMPRSSFRPNEQCIHLSSCVVDNASEDYLPLPPNFLPIEVHLTQLRDVKISNDNILNTFELHARRIWLLAVRPDALYPLSVMTWTFTKILSKTWTCFPTSITFKDHILGVSTTATMQRTDIYPVACAPPSDYIAEPWECDTQGCLEKNVQNNPYYLFATCEE
jgi:hypothetical protein